MTDGTDTTMNLMIQSRGQAKFISYFTYFGGYSVESRGPVSQCNFRATTAIKVWGYHCLSAKIALWNGPWKPQNVLNVGHVDLEKHLK